MTDADCVEFLQAILPRLGLCWPGFRKVRGLVRKRLTKRLRELRVSDLLAYRTYLEGHREEWSILDELCRIPISRFYRDRDVFECVERDVLPVLARAVTTYGRNEISCWSACCASGEEPYTLMVLWCLRLKPRFPQLQLRLVATDVDAHLLERARTGCYGASSMETLPPELRADAFVRRGTNFCIRDEFREIEFLHQDIREVAPEGQFDLIMCRNAVLTYFAPALQREVMVQTVARLRPGGALVIGIHESLPDGLGGLAPWPGTRAIYRKLDCGAQKLDQRATQWCSAVTSASFVCDPRMITAVPGESPAPPYMSISAPP